MGQLSCWVEGTSTGLQSEILWQEGRAKDPQTGERAERTVQPQHRSTQHLVGPLQGTDDQQLSRLQKEAGMASGHIVYNSEGAMADCSS